MTRLSAWSFLRSGFAQVAIAAAILVAIGSTGSRPTVFADTAAYVRQGEYWSVRAGLAQPLPQPTEASSFASLMPQAIAAFGPDSTSVAAARSPVYGLLLFLLAKIGTLWLVALAQAAAAAMVIRVATRVAAPDAPSATFWTAIAVLSMATSLPFFTTFAMPDLFGGLSILAGTVLIAAPTPPSRAERAFLWGLLGLGLSVHTANVPVIVAFAAVALAWALWRGRHVHQVARQAGALLILLVLVGAQGLAFQAAYRHDTGYAWGRPPFFMTRMLLDGPGKLYLDAVCPGGASPTLCRFKDRPMNDEHDILWKKPDGVFGSADYATRLQLEKDEGAFVVASLAFAPGLALAAAASNGLHQLAAFEVDDPLADPARYISHPWIDVPAIRHLLPGLTPCPDPEGCRLVATNRLIALLSIVHGVVLLFSLVLVGGAVFRARGRHDIEARKVTDMAMLLLAGVVINAAVCGMLSAVSPRYEARLIWLVPLAAVLARRAVAGTSAR